MYTDLQHRNTFVRAHRPYGVSCVVVGFDTSFPTVSSMLPTPRIFATEPSGVVQEYKAICVGEHAEAITHRLEDHHAELGEMSLGQLARLGARALLDARGGSKDEDRDEGDDSAIPPSVEIEVLLLGRSRGRIRSRRLFVKTRAAVEALSKVSLDGREDQAAEGSETSRREL